MTLEPFIQIAGVLHLGLVGLNIALPRHFGWGEQLERVSLLLRQIVYVHLGFLVLLLAMLGVLLTVFPGILTDPGPASTALMLGLAIFWGTRLGVQCLVYDRRLWRGKPFETVMHGLFIGIWGYFAIVFTGGTVLRWAGGVL